MSEQIKSDFVKIDSGKLYNADLRRIARQIEAENLAIKKIDNSWLNDEDKKSARKKHDVNLKGLTKNLNQLKTVSGVIGLFDRRNYELIKKSAEENGKAVLAQDENKCFYLAGHGDEAKVVVEGRERITHQIVDHEGKTVDTNEYIAKLILEGRIPPNSTLRVASCFVSALDITYNYPNDIKVERITEDHGEVSDVYITEDTRSNSNVVIMGGDTSLNAA